MRCGPARARPSGARPGRRQRALPHLHGVDPSASRARPAASRSPAGPGSAAHTTATASPGAAPDRKWRRAGRPGGAGRGGRPSLTAAAAGLGRPMTTHGDDPRTTPAAGPTARRRRPSTPRRPADQSSGVASSQPSASVAPGRPDGARPGADGPRPRTRRRPRQRATGHRSPGASPGGRAPRSRPSRPAPRRAHRRGRPARRGARAGSASGSPPDPAHRQARRTGRPATSRAVARAEASSPRRTTGLVAAARSRRPPGRRRPPARARSVGDLPGRRDQPAARRPGPRDLAEGGGDVAAHLPGLGHRGQSGQPRGSPVQGGPAAGRRRARRPAGRRTRAPGRGSLGRAARPGAATSRRRAGGPAASTQARAAGDRPASRAGHATGGHQPPEATGRRHQPERRPRHHPAASTAASSRSAGPCRQPGRAGRRRAGRSRRRRRRRRRPWPWRPARPSSLGHRHLAQPSAPVGGCRGGARRRRRRRAGCARPRAEPGGQRERLDPGRHVGGRVGVQRAAPALVPGVERGQQVDDLGAAHLADDEPVGPHPQRLPHQVRTVTSPAPSMLGGRASSPTTCGWSGRSSVASSTRTIRSAGSTRDSSAASSVVLPNPVPPLTRNASRADRPRAAGGRRPGSGRRRRPARRANAAGARHPQRDQRAGPGDRGEHRVEPGAVGQPDVDVGRGVVEPPPAGGGEPLGEAAHGLVVGEADVGPLAAPRRGRRTPGRRR